MWPRTVAATRDGLDQRVASHGAQVAAFTAHVFRLKCASATAHGPVQPATHRSAATTIYSRACSIKLAMAFAATSIAVSLLPIPIPLCWRTPLTTFAVRFGPHCAHADLSECGDPDCDAGGHCPCDSTDAARLCEPECNVPACGEYACLDPCDADLLGQLTLLHPMLSIHAHILHFSLWLGDGTGGIIHLRAITCGDPSMSACELWGAEYQECVPPMSL